MLHLDLHYRCSRRGNVREMSLHGCTVIESTGVTLEELKDEKSQVS
jgi:hypothetical protein